MDSGEVATLARTLHSHARALDEPLPSGYRCVFPFLQDVLGAAQQVVLSRNGSLEEQDLRAIKKRFTNQASSEFPFGPWTLEHVVRLLQGAGFITHPLTKDLCTFIDSQVSLKFHEKQVATQAQSVRRTSGVSRLAGSSCGEDSLSRSSSSSALVAIDSQNASDCPDHVPFRNLRSEDALSLAQTAFEQSDPQQLLCLVKALITERDSNYKSREYFRRRLSILRKEFAELKSDNSQLQSGIVHYSKRRTLNAKRFRLTVHGGYKLAMSRNHGHSGSIATLETLNADLSRQTCCAWEHLFSHSIIASHFAFHTSSNEAIEVLDSGLVPFEFHGFSGDATNSNLVQSSKVHTCTIRSSYVIPEGPEAPEGEPQTYKVLMRKCLGDLQLLPESVTASVIIDVYRKQLKSALPPTSSCMT